MLMFHVEGVRITTTMDEVVCIRITLCNHKKPQVGEATLTPRVGGLEEPPLRLDCTHIVREGCAYIVAMEAGRGWTKTS